MAALLQLKHLRERVQEQLDSTAHPGSPAPRSQASDSASKIDEEASLGDEKDTDPYANLAGITKSTGQNGETYYIVDEPPADPQAPRNWSRPRRIKAILLTVLITFVVTAASSIDSTSKTPAAAEFGVSDIVETLAGTGTYLVGFGAGALLASPLSELVGRYPVYVVTLVLFGIWIMAAGLAPNVEAQFAFRLLAGGFGSAPLTVAGGTVADVWDARERTWGFPLWAIGGFAGPVSALFVCFEGRLTNGGVGFWSGHRGVHWVYWGPELAVDGLDYVDH